MLAAVAGVDSTKLVERLLDSTRKFIGGMAAAGLTVNTDDTVPDQLRNHVMADAVWELLKDVPQLKVFQTDMRKAAAADAQDAYEKIIARDYGPIEPPAPLGADFATGNWNSENKIIGRMHPTPAPATQFQVSPASYPAYANPNAAGDIETVVISDPPTDLLVTPGPMKLVLTWVPPASASSFKIYKGTAAGLEIVPALATVTTNSYTDTSVATGTAYYYKVSAVNAAGESALSTEASGVPT